MRLVRLKDCHQGGGGRRHSSDWGDNSNFSGCVKVCDDVMVIPVRSVSMETLGITGLVDEAREALPIIVSASPKSDCATRHVRQLLGYDASVQEQERRKRGCVMHG